MNTLIDKYENIPNIIESQITLKKPNSPIRIFKGNFELINTEKEEEKKTSMVKFISNGSQIMVVFFQA